MDGTSVLARDYVRRVLTLLAGVAVLVLILTCANVSNLLLSRSVARRGEVAVRRALGVSLSRLIRAQLTESLILAAAAGVAGLMLAALLVTQFQGMTLPGGNPWVAMPGIGRVRLDWRVAALTGSLAVGAGLIVSVLPGVASAGADLLPNLKGSGNTVAGRGRLRGALVAFQLAVSVSLLVTALLLIRTVRNLGRIDVGFDADRVAALTIWPPFSGYSRPESQRILRQTVANLRLLPGVEAVSLSAYAPFTSAIGDAVQRQGAGPLDPSAPAVSTWVGPDYFQTMGIPLLAGRGFSENEVFLPANPSAEGVAVISGAQAQAIFGTVDAVGRLVQNENASRIYRVVGVAQDARWSGLLPGSDQPPLYQPLSSSLEGATILVRSRLPLSDLRPAAERALRIVAPAVPLFEGERLSDKVNRSVSEPRLLAKALSAFALLAVALAGVGLYGVVAVSVGERIRELGIRMALGAQPREIFALVLRRAVTLGASGLILGVAGGVGLGRVVASRLYGVSPVDSASYVLAAALLFAVVLAASAAPARRATRVDPVVVLRHE